MLLLGNYKWFKNWLFKGMFWHPDNQGLVTHCRTDDKFLKKPHPLSIEGVATTKDQFKFINKCFCFSKVWKCLSSIHCKSLRSCNTKKHFSLKNDFIYLPIMKIVVFEISVQPASCFCSSPCIQIGNNQNIKKVNGLKSNIKNKKFHNSPSEPVMGVCYTDWWVINQSDYESTGFMHITYNAIQMETIWTQLASWNW